jgi:type IV secretory pathway VirB3-like protein
MTIKISELANLTVVQANTIVPVVSNVTGTLTTVQANVQQLQNYIIANGVSANITALYTNAATQSDLIIGINANVTAANVGMTGYVNAVTTNWTANALAQQTTLNTLLANAATQSDLIIGINANVSAANVGMIGYVNNSTTTANVGMIGYVDRGNTIVAAGIVTANVGMKGYVDNQTYSNVQVSSYLPTYSGNIADVIVSGQLVVFGNTFVANTYVPTANNSVGAKGQISYDSSYIYVCINTNTWRRANLAIW